ncbi:hypothetical protein CEXT_124231 [Caerostris extrusa]|uniref:Uncharacterized protein n=1 Tax=Caerostris extrusa TaxID=172846 RepID=A0AAV4R1G0_CAEEX|nr:hypothetical protein CEXT_124231 [Caerostris extrusa]
MPGRVKGTVWRRENREHSRRRGSIKRTSGIRDGREQILERRGRPFCVHDNFGRLLTIRKDTARFGLNF